MDGQMEKRLIVFASQYVRQYGIHAMRMDTIARGMNVSKRTLYKVYGSKDNFMRACLASYTDRVMNLFRLLRMETPEPQRYLWALTKAFIDNFYRAEPVFWREITECYPHIHETIRNLWTEELAEAIEECKRKRWVIMELDSQRYASSLYAMFYHGRMAGSAPQAVSHSAYFMWRGIMTIEGILRL